MLETMSEDAFIETIYHFYPGYFPAITFGGEMSGTLFDHITFLLMTIALE